MYKEDNNNDIDCLELYNKEIDAFNVLSIEEEKELYEKYKNGDLDAKNKFISANLRLVRYVAKKFKNTGISIQDLIQEGNIGLMIAVDRFEPSKGRFSTYAYKYIAAYIRFSIPKLNNEIGQTKGLVDKINKYNNQIMELAKKLNHEPSIYEISEGLGISLKKVDEYEMLRKTKTSVNISHGEDERVEMIEMLPDLNVNVEKDALDNVFMEDLLFLLNNSNLLESEKKVLLYRSGLMDGKEYTLEEIGKIFNRTKQNIQQIQSRAIRKIILSRSISELEAFLNYPSRFDKLISKFLKGCNIEKYLLTLKDKRNEIIYMNEYSNKDKRFLSKVRVNMKEDFYIKFLEEINKAKSSILNKISIEDLSIIVLSIGSINGICYTNNEIATLLGMDYEIIIYRSRRISHIYNDLIQEYLSKGKIKSLKK